MSWNTCKYDECESWTARPKAKRNDVPRPERHDKSRTVRGR